MRWNVFINGVSLRQVDYRSLTYTESTIVGKRLRYEALVAYEEDYAQEGATAELG